jgi:hypothetical protein
MRIVKSSKLDFINLFINQTLTEPGVFSPILMVFLVIKCDPQVNSREVSHVRMSTYTARVHRLRFVKRLKIRQD